MKAHILSLIHIFPLKAVVTPSNRSWVFGDLLAHLQEEHAAVTAAKENQTL